MDFQSAARFGERRVMVTDYDETAVEVNAKVVDEDTGEVICESGGGGGELNTVNVTIQSSVTQQISEEDKIGFNGAGVDENQYDTINAVYNSNGNYYTSFDWDITTEETEINVLLLGESFHILAFHQMTATGSATVQKIEDPAPAVPYYMATVTGDCTLVIADNEQN